MNANETRTITVHYAGKTERLLDRDGRIARAQSSPRVFITSPTHFVNVLRGEYRWMRTNGTPREIARWHVGRMLDMTYGRTERGRFGSDLVPSLDDIKTADADSGSWELTDDDAYNAGWYGFLTGLLSERKPGWHHFVLCGYDDASEDKPYGTSAPVEEDDDNEEGEF